MSKIPENLQKVLTDKNTDDLFKELFLDDNFDKPIESIYSMLPDSDDPFNIYTQTSIANNILSVLEELGSFIGKSIIGYSHSSDVLDDSSHEEYSELSPKYKKNKNTNYSRLEFYEEVKENCIKKISENFYSTSIKTSPIFDKLIKLLQADGRSHIAEPEYLEHILINSKLFQELVLQKFVSYSG